MENHKIEFLKNQFVPLLKQLDAKATGKWGVLNAQQMVEHFSESVRIANRKIQPQKVTLDEHLPKMRAFMLSDKPFKENTPNPLMNKEGSPLKHVSMQEAIEELRIELNDFFSAFEKDHTLNTSNPFFGSLNFEENVHLLHKHALHHLKQFNLIIKIYLSNQRNIFIFFLSPLLSSL